MVRLSECILVVVALCALCCSPGTEAAAAAVRAPVPSVGRIVGGTPTIIENYPYTGQVLLYYAQFDAWALTCAGTILSTRHMLSAAHCFTEIGNPRVLNTRVGSTSSVTGGSTHAISQIIMHEAYMRPPRDNDIAILVLSTALRYSAAVQPGLLPAQGFEVPDNSPVIHAGWGATSEGGFGTINLMHVTIYTINRVLCRSRYNYLQSVTNMYYYISDNMICAGILDVGGRDACQGDSGGPLIYGSTVVGITSWGEGCANGTYPGVSARVSSYTNWISTQMRQFPGSATTSAVSKLLLAASLLAATFYAL